MFKIVQTKEENGYLSVVVSNDGEEWTSLISTARKKLINNLELKGFRKGKVPENIALQNISSSQIWNEAASLLIDQKVESINEEILKHKIIARPNISIDSVSDESITMTFSAPLMPQVELGDLTKVKLKMDSFEVSKEELDAELKNLDQIKFESKIIEEAAKLGDTVTIDFSGSVDGEKFDGGTADDFELELGSKSFIDTFEDQLVGLKSGEEKLVKVTFPETYPVENLANKLAEFEVKVKNVKRKNELSPEELDKKAKELKFESFKQIEDSIINSVKDRKKADIYNKFMRKVIKTVDEMEETKFDIPEELIIQETEEALKKFEHQLQHSGLNLKDYLKMINKSQEDFKKENLRENAINQIKEQIIFEAIDQKVNIEITEKDIENKYNELAKTQNIDLKIVKEQVTEDQIKNEVRFFRLVESFVE